MHLPSDLVIWAFFPETTGWVNHIDILPLRKYYFWRRTGPNNLTGLSTYELAH
jgi:hypothetical protein